MRSRKMRKLPFAAIMEAHESGYPHLHILLRSLWIDKRWLSEQMRDIADSPIVDIRRIDNRAKVNGYVAKYAGKAAHKFGTAKRYWFSQDYRTAPRREFKPVFDTKGQWEREPGSINTFCHNWETHGWFVERVTARHARATKHQRAPPREVRGGPPP